jgi:RNA-directed DNA polymerase
MRNQSPNAPQAVQSCHDILLWIIPQLDKLPRQRRYTLGERIESGLLDVLGYRVFPTYRRLRRDNGYRFRRRLRGLAQDYARGGIEIPDVSASVAAWVGHARHADSWGLRSAVLSGIVFRRSDGAASGGLQRPS